MGEAISISQATVDDVDDIAPLFDAYRQFYDQTPDTEKARTYIKARLVKGEAVIFVARNSAGAALGFTLLYPTFCSVDAKPVYVLYDLFVDPNARQGGVGTALLNAAHLFASEKQVAWLKLETAHINKAAQALYEKLGWVRDDEFHTYHYYPSP